MTANEIIARQASDAILAKGHTPESIALAIGVSSQLIRKLCIGEVVETSTVSLLSRALGENLFKNISEMIDTKLK